MTSAKLELIKTDCCTRQTTFSPPPFFKFCIRMLNSTRWGSLRPPGPNLPWYYSPNSLASYSSVSRSPEKEKESAEQQRTPYSRVESEKSSGLTSTTGVNQRIAKLVLSSTPPVETTPLRVLLSTPDRPGTAPRLHFDDLRGTRDRTCNLDSSPRNLGKTTVAGKKTAFVVAMQVSPGNSAQVELTRHIPK